MAKVTDLKTRSQEYWEDRFDKVQSNIFKESDKSFVKINKLFSGTYKEMDAVINETYNKYGKVVEAPIFTTLPDGNRVISGTEKTLALDDKTMAVKLTKGTRMDKLNNDLRQILLSLSADQKQIMMDTLSFTAQESYYQTMYEIQKGYGVGKSFNILTKQQVQSLIRNPVNGADFVERIGINNDKLAQEVNQIMKAGITQRIPNKEMARRLADKMKISNNVAITLINTEITNSSNQATLFGYQESGIVKQYQFLATLDDRTSDTCQDLDQEVFDLDKAVTGLNMPPMHPNCRSTTIAYFDNSLDALTRIARDLGGNSFLVPGDMTYSQYKAMYID